MLHVIQSGSGPRRPVVFLFLIGSMVYDQLKSAVGPEACVVTDDGSAGKETLTQLLAVATKGGDFEVSGLVLGGFSAGCQRVRALLMAGVSEGTPLLAAVVADGTAASMPPATWQIEVWSKLADQAKAGGVTFAASHTLNVYTEKLTAPNTPFMATLHVLQRATGFPLPTATPHGTLTSAGNLFVYSFSSTECDAAAHGRQETEALPMMLSAHVRPLLAASVDDGAVPVVKTAHTQAPPAPAPTTSAPMLAGSMAPTPIASRDLKWGLEGPDVIVWNRWLDKRGLLGGDPVPFSGKFDDRTRTATRRMQNAIGLAVDGVVGPGTRSQAGAWPAPVLKADDDGPTWQDSSLTLGARALRWALQFAGREDLERLGPNAGPEIAEWLSPAIRRATGAPLHLSTGEWCAAFFCASASAVAAPGEAVPHGYRAAGVELVADAKENGTWREASTLRAGTWQPSEGDGCVLTRALEGQSWETHTCRVVGVSASGFWTVGGNESNTVRLTLRRASDTDLLGFVSYG